MAKPAYPLELPEREDTRSWPAQGEWTYEDYWHPVPAGDLSRSDLGSTMS